MTRADVLTRLPKYRKLTKSELVGLGVVTSDKAASTYVSIANNIESIRKLGWTKRRDDPWEWVLENPEEVWRVLLTSKCPRFGAYKYTYLLLKGIGAISPTAGDRWHILRKSVLDAELAAMEERVDRLTEKDVSWTNLFLIMTSLPKGSRVRLWFAMMLLNPPMRNELVSLAYAHFPAGANWNCRGVIGLDKIDLHSTKMTTRSKNAIQTIPMSRFATKELEDYLHRNPQVRPGTWIFQDGSGKDWSDIGLRRQVAASLSGDLEDFSWLSANVFRRAFCREVLPYVWMKWGYGEMVRLNSLIGHSIEAVAAYAAAPKSMFAVDRMLKEEYNCVGGPFDITAHRFVAAMVAAVPNRS